MTQSLTRGNRVYLKATLCSRAIVRALRTSALSLALVIYFAVLELIVKCSFGTLDKVGLQLCD